MVVHRLRISITIFNFLLQTDKCKNNQLYSLSVHIKMASLFPNISDVFCIAGIFIYGRNGDKVGTLESSFILTVFSLIINVIGAIVIGITRSTVMRTIFTSQLNTERQKPIQKQTQPTSSVFANVPCRFPQYVPPGRLQNVPTERNRNPSNIYPVISPSGIQNGGLSNEYMNQQFVYDQASEQINFSTSVVEPASMSAVGNEPINSTENTYLPTRMWRAIANSENQ